MYKIKIMHIIGVVYKVATSFYIDSGLWGLNARIKEVFYLYSNTIKGLNSVLATIIYFCTSEILNTAHLTPFFDNTMFI